MSRRPPNVNVFNYLDYRVFLRDWYADRKKSRIGFSFRSFSSDAGFTSPNFMKMVMDGIRNLTEKSIVPFLKGLKLNKQEQEFFRNLVFFSQARTPEKRNLFYERMLQSRKYSQLKPLEKSQYEFFSTWYHPVVRELVLSPGFDGTPEQIVDKIRPSITLSQASASLRLLETLGFVRRNPEGRWEQSQPLLTTGPELRSQAFMKYHQTLLEVARQTLPMIPPERRDVSSLTLGITADQIPLLKEKVREFRGEIMKMVASNDRTDHVYLLNIQFLPVTPGEDETDSNHQ